jgi:hypothetical protein
LEKHLRGEIGALESKKSLLEQQESSLLAVISSLRSDHGKVEKEPRGLLGLTLSPPACLGLKSSKKRKFGTMDNFAREPGSSNTTDEPYIKKEYESIMIQPQVKHLLRR